MKHVWTYKPTLHAAQYSPTMRFPSLQTMKSLEATSKAYNLVRKVLHIINTQLYPTWITHLDIQKLQASQISTYHLPHKITERYNNGLVNLPT